ncbi:MAG: hypothetical protein LBS21_14535 [Clostridiales bacterium]|jgi:uncharacterized protein YbaR (Trm112 family)|nr:hypothetical protein [Clostridiales bacterium]
MAVKYIFSNPFFVKFKKHYCPECGNILRVKRESQIVNSRSEEAKNFDFYNGENFLIGGVKFIWNVFYCDVCNKTFSIKDIRQYEKNLKQK